MSSQYAKVIVNPVAGAGRTGRLWPQIMGLFKGHGLRFEHDITEAPGHAIELARAAAEKGYEMVVSVGGDGTINEIVNGLYAAGNIGDALLGIVSTGTGGDYIRTVGIPRRYEDACRCFLQPKKRTVDLGIVEYAKNGGREERLFVNFAGMGFDAEIVRRTTQQFKALGSLPSYLLGTLTTLVSYANKNISLIVDGHRGRKAGLHGHHEQREIRRRGYVYRAPCRPGRRSARCVDCRGSKQAGPAAVAAAYL